MRTLVLVMVALASLAPEHAVVAKEHDAGDDAAAYCSWVEAVAGSESALAFSPQLFVDYGVVNGNDAGFGAGASALPPTHRLTAGARLSLVGIWRGVATRRRAGADCRRYGAESGLERLVVENREQLSPAALAARLAVLRAARPRAREIVRQVRDDLDHAHATVEELQAAQLRAQALEAAIAEAETQAAGLSRSALPPPEELLRRHRDADAEVARWEGRLRGLQAFDLSVRGGYDRFFGLRDELPLFAVVSLVINPAALYQPVAERHAAEARAQFVRGEVDGIERRAELVTTRLRATAASERRRLDELRALVSELEGRLRTLDAIGSDRLRRMREATWFEWVQLEAEREFLRVHTAELSAMLGEEAR